MRGWRKPVGWRGESYRHYLAGKGLSSKRNVYFALQKMERDEVLKEMKRKGMEPYEMTEEEQARTLKSFGEQVKGELESQREALLREKLAAQGKLLEKYRERQAILKKIEKLRKEEEAEGIHGDVFSGVSDEGDVVMYHRLVHTVSEEEAERISGSLGVQTRIEPREDGYDVYVATRELGDEE